MVLKGKYILKYVSNKEDLELVVEVHLKMVDGEIKNNQNIFYGIVLVNGTLKKEYDLHSCVNAKFATEEIGIKLKNELIEKLKSEKKSFKLKREIL